MVPFTTPDIEQARQDAFAARGPWEVVSSIDDGVVFDAASVAEEARLRRLTNRAAAERLARQHDDPLTDEVLTARAAIARATQLNPANPLRGED
jgi:hypothetical protein